MSTQQLVEQARKDAEELAGACQTLRRTSVPLAELIPRLQSTADRLRQLAAELERLERKPQAVDAAIVDSLLPECYDIINSMLATNGSLYPKDLNNRARKLLPSKYEQSFGHDRGAKKGQP